ncbi:hypothetical protein AtubIFM57258_009686 [Aspergillus tubingensis]|nr:hypothetical protein AtubIFM57258_009686 [Aspergillus tubingensis]
MKEQCAEDQRSRDVDRQGRQRPRIFPNLVVEIGFCVALMLSQIMSEFFISGFNVLIPSVSQSLNIPAASTGWPSSAFALTAGSSLLLFGQLADKYGGFVVFTSGLTWHLVWTLIAGFSQNEIMLNFCRALQGFGPAAILSAGIMLLGSIYPPGPRKNIVFSIYGGCAPIGFSAGILVSGIADQLLNWRWYFWIGAILILITLVSALVFIPAPIRTQRPNPTLKIDYLGAALFISSLILIFFAVNDCGHAPNGWRTPYIPVTLVIGCILLAGAIYTEHRLTSSSTDDSKTTTQTATPILPLTLFRVPHLPALLIALFLFYGTFGIWLLYTVTYMQNILHISPLMVVVWYLPFALGGIVLSFVGGTILHIVPGTILLILSGIGWVMAPLLFAILPHEGVSYWAYIFPAMICGTVGVDITYNITNVFLTTTLPEQQQGLAAAVANSVLFLGVSFFVGWGDFVAEMVDGQREGYKAAFWLGVACAGVALAVLVGWVKIEAARGEDGKVEGDGEEGGGV